MSIFSAKRTVLLGATTVIPMITACGEELFSLPPADCCPDFKPGQSMLNVPFAGDVQIDGQIRAYAQAAGDLSVTAAAAIKDVTNACMRVAVDLGAEPDAPGAAPKSAGALAQFWCEKAIAQLNASLSASGSPRDALTIDFQPPKCSVSLRAQEACQAACSADSTCDIKSTLPTCNGGTLEVACKGECAASAGATLTCEGSCTGNCKGSCTTQGGVACEGKCEGNCEATASAGEGIQADGTCNGIYKGTCSATSPNVKCDGSCKGECSTTCKAEAGASVRCNGKCSGDYEPLSCTGGRLEGGCNVGATCEANCNASASAKADCTPPELKIVASARGQASAQINAVIDTLKLNLPKLLVVAQARGQAFIETAVVVLDGGRDVAAGASGKVNMNTSTCIVVAGVAAAEAVADMKIAVQQSLKVVATVK